MTESEAIEELKYDCNELGKSIPCDTSLGWSFENAYGMAIQALEKQIPKKPYKDNEKEYCPICHRSLFPNEHHCICGQKIDRSDKK